MLLWMIPAASVYGVEAETDQTEAAEGQVVVLYEDGAVDSSAPATKSERRSAEKARKARSFGKTMEKYSEDAESSREQAENTLGQQEEILAETLGSDYVIEDTIVLGSGDTDAKSADETVVSTISSDKYTVDELCEMLSANKNIQAAEPNYCFRASAIPDWNDTYINEAWQNAEKGINADSAWNSEDFDKTENPVIVAVMDTGIDYDHEDLRNHIWTAPDDFKLNGKHGMDFVEKDADPMDQNGHGTHCAGIIAAEANNGVGTAGVAGPSEKVLLMSVRVLDEEGGGYFEDIISAFYYLERAKKAGADIRAVNCSFGASTYSDIFDKVIEKVGESGILTIASAGNESSDNDEMLSSPANCKSDYVISVAALDENGELASYSNYGTKNVDVAAPGSNILSSVSYNNYAPYLYDNARIGETTEYYGEFGGAEIIEETDDAGNTIQKVVPVSGTDYNGDPVTSAGTFGESVMIADLTKESAGFAELELVDNEEDAFPIGNNSTSLRWKITGARAGDKFVLYFPYEKMASSNNDTLANVAFRTHTEPDGGMGDLEYGDVIAYVDKNGKLSYKTTSSEDFFGAGLPVTWDWNSIWHASGDPEALVPHCEIKSLSEGVAGSVSTSSSDGYGLGMVYTAGGDGDVYIDISSLAISKVGADENDFGMYDVYSGTSMATPVVTGTAGLLAAMAPSMSAGELRNKIFQTVRGGYSDICSTGGAIDFASYSSTPELSKPFVSSATCDFDKHTVTLSAGNFGSAPAITAKLNLAGRTEEIAAEDITLSDGKIVIGDKYGLTGSDVTFTIENTESGLTGSRTFYLVKGLKKFTELFTMNKTQEEEEFIDWSKGSTDKLISASDVDDNDDEETEVTFPSGLTYIKGTDRFLLHDSDYIYRLTRDEDGNYCAEEIGDSISETVGKYAAKAAKTEELWAPDGGPDEKGEYYTLTMMCEPVCIGDVVYTLIHVDLVDRAANLLLGLDIANGSKWTVYYDSLSDFGTAPAGLKFNEIYGPSLGAYNGRIYYFAGYPTDEEGVPTGNTKVFRCTPSEKGSVWESSAEMPATVTEGRAIAQGGNLYYFFGRTDEGAVDYNVYKFNGSSWSVAGQLPAAIFKRGADSADILFFFDSGYTEDLSCAYGIDDRGIIFAGRSFDQAGDVFRFNTGTGETELLGYTVWGDLADRVTDGTVAGGKLLVQYDIEDGEKTTAKTIPVKSGYVKVTIKKTGKGTGTVKGAGSFPKGETSTITVTPSKGSYVYEVRSTGFSPNLNKKYGKAVTASKGTQKAVFKGSMNATMTIHFGKISTRLTVKKVKTVKVGKRKLTAYTDGTINGVKWKSSNKKYAKVNKNGTITFKKAGIGKTVKLTAISKENPKLKKTIKVKIKKAKKTKKAKKK